jgi:hypothetical protein
METLMTPSTDWKEFRLETPATYRIRIQGYFDSSWIDQVTGMSISKNTSEGGPTVTTLTGHLTDQAMLSGILNTLYDLRLPLLSVENLDEKRSE